MIILECLPSAEKFVEPIRSCLEIKKTSFLFRCYISEYKREEVIESFYEMKRVYNCDEIYFCLLNSKVVKNELKMMCYYRWVFNIVPSKKVLIESKYGIEKIFKNVKKLVNKK